MEALFGKIIQKKINKADSRKAGETEKAEPEGMQNWITCPECRTEVNPRLVAKNKYICYRCGHYFRVSAGNRIRMVADQRSFEEWFGETEDINPLDFPEYSAKLAQAREKTGLSEGVIVGKARIFGEETALGVIDSRFLMGSMGHTVGERITRTAERATAEKLPLILFCCSGGARMQEGIISLMQMEKTAAALKRHADAGLLYIPVLTDPTTGGVTASFAMLGDIILAEPGALIGFAGPRVIEQTIGKKLPEGFQRAEFQLEHGFADALVERKDLKLTLHRLLRMHHRLNGWANFDPFREEDDYSPTAVSAERARHAKPLDAWDKVHEVRKTNRPGTMDYIEQIFDEFLELHGDRCYRDDPAVVGGIARLDGQPVTVIGIRRGSSAQECLKNNFGMPSPEGYRKALRLMKQAEKFGRPIISFVNTSGAYPGLEAEENGQGEAIARNLFEMSALKVPVLCLLIGEGGSGGALALAVGNEVWMMENATYAILSPEGFASILWKDGKRAKEAARIMKITAQDLLSLGVIEKIIPEFGTADKDSLVSIARFMKGHMKEFLIRREKMSPGELAEERYRRFRTF